MVLTTPDRLATLYEKDEIAWLEAMAARIAAGRHHELDFTHLEEYLTDMAIRERREVKSRLARLLAHLLKWSFQPTKRTRSWIKTQVVQRQALADRLESGSLRRHAGEVLEAAYRASVEQAEAGTGLPHRTSPPLARTPWLNC